MTSTLRRFTDAYASMTVAVYEPLVVRWYSRAHLWLLADGLLRRAAGKGTSGHRSRAMAAASVRSARPRLPADPTALLDAADLTVERLEEHPTLAAALETLPARRRRPLMATFAGWERLAGGVLVPGGGVREPGEPGRRPPAEVDLPLLTRSLGHDIGRELDVEEVRAEMLGGLVEVMTHVVGADAPIPGSELREMILDAAGRTFSRRDVELEADLLPPGDDYGEWLSPIGVAHFYRQLYFLAEEGVGPIEQAFTVAPGETLEVVYETVRRQIHEEVTEVGSETVSETAVEEKNQAEVSDKVSSMVQRDSSAAMSTSATVSASGSVGVWSVGGSATIGASADLKSSTQRGTDTASRRLRETTRRAAERITKSVSVTTRDVLDVTTTNVTRRVIANPGSAPMSYGLRRVLQRVRVKVQSLGPRLVWQTYVRDPGSALARSRFVHFMEAQPLPDASAPPGTKPRPVGGTDTGSTSAALKWDATRRTYYVTVVVRTGSDRTVTAVSIDSISDLEGGGKGDLAPSAKNDLQWDKSWDAATATFSVNIGVLEGDAASVQVNYSYTYEPGSAVMAAWESELAAAQDEFEKSEAEKRQKALQEEFERGRALLTERSRIRPRPANDLRREERYEIMNRMVSHVFADGAAAPGPLDIELFHRYFELEAMFVHTHPSWWRPRYASSTSGLARPAYEITSESEPAPMGSSLGWVLQLDGDARRNEFLNSPWVRVCVPMRGGRERDAVAWLAQHIEGEIGYDPSQQPLKGLLADIEALRGREARLGIEGPDYVTVDSTVGAPGTALTPEAVYPVVDEFEVTVPSEGFVYDEIVVEIP